MSERIVVIDGNSLINRAYYAMQKPMITKDGIYTQGIFGFINMLNKIIGDYEPAYLTVAFDLKAPTFRHLEYDAYKAGRKPMPPELVMQMPLLKEVLAAMRIKTLELEGYEADDIIGTAARLAEEADIEPLIITGDKDALQLATDKTKILITKKGISEFALFDYDKMVEHYGLTPAQFIDLKGLMGDSSDNIPGIPGIGEKTGIALLKQFDSVENLLARADEITKPALRKKVEENAQLAVLSKRLATINRFVPIELDFEKMRVGEPDYDKLIALYQKLEFNSFLKKLSKKEIPQETFDFAPGEVKQLRLRNEAELAELDALRQKEVFLKTFGDSSHVRKPQMDGIFLRSGDVVYYLDCRAIPAEICARKLNTLQLRLWGHDIKDDLYSLMRYEYQDFEVSFDTAIAAYVLDVSKNRYDLKSLAFEQLHLALKSPEEYFGENSQLDMFGTADTQNLEYGIITSEIAAKLRAAQEVKMREEDLERVFCEAELPLIEVLAGMEAEGIRADNAFLDKIGQELQAQADKLEEEIYAYAGCRFNIKSPYQLGDVLFETLKLPAGKKGKRGYSTSADILEKIRDQHPIVEAVLQYRNLTKLNSTYVEGMKPLIGEDGKIRAHFQQTVTATGRISCTEPNLQNIPIRQETGRSLRKAFSASDADHILVGADYSQIELRILAHLSQDPGLLEAFRLGEDIHKMTAAKVLGIPMDKVTPNDRSKAKAVNFGVIYGMSGFGLSENLHITRKEAESYIAEYFKKHQKVKEYMDGEIARCRETGYAETILGRKRAIHEINASAYMVRQAGERLAMNTPIQGSAADIIKLAMGKVYRELKAKHPRSKLILQVHDELIINAAKEELAEIEELLIRNMESAMRLSVKLVSELNEGENWYDLK